MQVVEAIVSSVAPQAIPAEVVMVHGEGDVRRLLVKGIDVAVAQSAERLALFSSLVLLGRPRHAVSPPDASGR